MVFVSFSREHGFPGSFFSFVSVSVSFYGGSNLSVIPFPFSRKHGFYGGINLPDSLEEEEVSLSLPRNGFPVDIHLVVSVPFSRKQGFSGGISLPESRAPYPGDNGGLCLGPHEGVEMTLSMRTSGAHAKPMPSSGSSGLLMSGSEPRSPDPFYGFNGGWLVGSHDSFKAPVTESYREDDVQTTPEIGTSVKATNFGYNPTIPTIRPGE